MTLKKFFHHPEKPTPEADRTFFPPVEKSTFVRSVSLDDLDKQIKKANRFSEFWERHKKNIIDLPLSKYLGELLDKKGLKRSDVVVRTGLDKSYVYQIFSGQKNPSRDKLITIAFGMGLSEEETQNMLKLSGLRELWPKDERDALLLFAIRHGLSLVEVHTELERYGLDPLATSVK